MRSFDEIEKNAYKKADIRLARKKHRQTMIRRSAALSFGAAAIIGVGICANALKPPRKPAPESRGIITETSEETSAEAVNTTTLPQTSKTTTLATMSFVNTSISTTVRTTAVAAITNGKTSTIKTVITTTSPMASEHTPETTTTISQGGITMKKITAFIAALTTTGLLSPTPSYAVSPPDGHRIMFTQSELNMFKEYEDGTYDPDINGDTTFDICDVFELRLYGERFMYCFETYGYDQSKYTELSEQYSKEAANRILKCYNAEDSFRFMPVSSGGTDPNNPTGAQILARYYLYKNGSFPSDSEVFSELQNRSFIAPTSESDIASFAEYIGKLCDNIVYSDTYDDKRTYSEAELEAFARFDSGEVNADVNGDGVKDFFDGYDVLVYHVLKNVRNQEASKNDFFSVQKWSQIETNGDVTLDGCIDIADYELLNSYYCHNTLAPSVMRDEMAEHLNNYIKEKSTVSENTDASLPALIIENITVIKGDPNIDGKVSIADSVSILQHIGNRDKYCLSPQGLVNGDVDGIAGVTANDARVLQQWDAGIR